MNKKQNKISQREKFDKPVSPCEEIDLTTQLAYERTFLANERTLIAWLRTAVALVSAGLGVVKFLDDEGPRFLMKTLGILLVLTGEMSYIIAYRKHNRVSDRLCRLQNVSTTKWLLFPLNITIFLMSIISLIIIFDN